MTGRANGDTLQYTAPTLLPFGGSSLVTSLDVRALETNCGVRVGWRTADVLSELPNALQTLGTQRTTNDNFVEPFDVSAQTSSLLVQVGVFAGLTTGTTPKGGFTRVWASVIGGGFVVARQRIHFQQTSSTLSIPIGQPFCAAGVTGLMAAMVFYGVQGTIVSPTFVWRSFDTGDARFPNSWSSVYAGSSVTTDSQVNVAGSVTTTSAQMAQAGVQYSTSGTNPNGVVDIIVAAKM